jgi:hypothetical protein
MVRGNYQCPAHVGDLYAHVPSQAIAYFQNSKTQSRQITHVKHVLIGSYKIQDGTIHDPREDAVAAMRLYRRMRSFKHSGAVSQSPDLFGLTLQDLDATEISCSSAYSYTKSTFYCWCLDCN